VLPIALSVILGISAVYVSASSHGRGARWDQTAAQQMAILRGQDSVIDGYRFYSPALQNRILFPGCLWALGHLDRLRPVQWYGGLRTASAIAAFFVFWRVSIRIASRDPRVVAVGSLALFFSLLFTFNHPAEHPTDFPDLMFMLLIIRFCAEGRLAPVVALAALAALNRESAVFAGVIWAVCQGFGQSGRPRWRALVIGAVVSLQSYAVALGARYLFGGHRAIGPDTQHFTGPLALLTQIGFVIDDPSLFSWPILVVLMMSPWAIWIWMNRDCLDRGSWLLLVCAAVVTGVTLLFGLILELRVLIPPLAVIAIVAVQLEERRRSGAGEPAAAGRRCPGLSSPSP
jgi:hypothetical protein